jgi:cephalosporin hydroxylase
MATQPNESDIVEAFHRLYYDNGVWARTDWLGVQVLKCPLDLWIYQEILHRTRPDLIVETGTYVGGSAWFLARVCDLIGTGRVVTIDHRELEGRPEHDRITYLMGFSTAAETLATVRAGIGDGERVMVILDSKHTRDHVLAELRAYAPLVSEGCYLIVEDTNVSLVAPDYGPGPAEALEQFLAEETSFEVDRECEKFLLTFQPGGYLRKLGAGSRPNVGG